METRHIIPNFKKHLGDKGNGNKEEYSNFQELFRGIKTMEQRRIF